MPIQAAHSSGSTPYYLRASTFATDAQALTYQRVPFDTLIEDETAGKFALDVATVVGRITVAEDGVMRLRANAIFVNADVVNGATVDLQIVKDPAGTPVTLDHASIELDDDAGPSLATLEVDAVFAVTAGDVIEVQAISTDTDVALFPYNDLPSAQISAEWFAN